MDAERMDTELMNAELIVFAETVKNELDMINDPRRRQGRRYPLTALLLLLMLGFLRGMKNIKEILDKSKHDKKLLQALNIKRVPAGGTYTNLFDQLPMEAINAVLQRVGMRLGWKKGQIAIDGKTVKGSIKNGLYLHILNASTEDGIPLVQKKSASGGGEIPSAEAVLSHLDLENQVVTGDAMFAQRSLCRQIAKKKRIGCSS